VGDKAHAKQGKSSTSSSGSINNMMDTTLLVMKKSFPVNEGNGLDVQKYHETFCLVIHDMVRYQYGSPMKFDLEVMRSFIQYNTT
jgi:hypothetical protein